ncbi:L,D-transpeptidase family protein [Paenibacillus tengchongensis]|uniref:L,D-transpeptidase family protein n=1 Tax=Paenibacillus tengchongensis TaxID=2608684 RepID=UPI001FE8CB62|nr:L,D-transpeptidase family protein [Paenibacillus tengchongensis]
MNLQTAVRQRTVGTRLTALAIALLLLCMGSFAFAGTRASAAASSDLIIVNKKTNQLAFFTAGRLERVFPVATGKTRELTPEGTFQIVVKVKNRPYYKEKIPGGDPANPLGDRWLGLEVNGTMGTTYAIHGNNNEASIGKYVSAGCIRMHNEDIHWLYPRVPKNTKVIITSTTKGMEEIAKKHGYPLGGQTFEGTIVAGGKVVQLQQPLLLAESRVYVPLRETANVLGAGLSQEAGGALVITLGSHKAVMKPLGDAVTVNGKKLKVLPSRYLNGRLMIPLSAFPQVFGVQFKWDPAGRTITIP